MNNELTSIICAAYNAASYIEEMIQSIISQTNTEWELIIIDDCSKDNTVDIVNRYVNAYPNIYLIRNEKNLGPGGTRNIGIEMAKGRYIAICDSDDIWYPEKLELQINYMKSHNNIPISYTSYELIKENGEETHKPVRVASKPLGYSDYLKDTIIGFSTSIIDRKLCPDIKLHNMPSREDTLLWCELLRKGYKAYGMDRVLVKYRLHESSVSFDKAKAAKQVWELYRDVLNIPLIKRSYYFVLYAFHAFKKRYIN